MRKLYYTLLFGIFLSACSWLPVYHPDFQQGNMMTAQEVAKLHAGMTQAQVEGVMGSAVLQNTFNDNRLLYAYEYKPNNQPMKLRYVALTFSGGRLVKIEKDLTPKIKDV